PIVLYHHERWDGRGYPKGLREDTIPLFARIISIVDVFDVLTHDRPYKKARSWQDAITELEDNAGTQFDPFLLKIFMENLDKFPLMPKRVDGKVQSFS
ncbi:HD-GYP domain-containing protein, partial [candidate division CSSED10-310 bacterium]